MPIISINIMKPERTDNTLYDKLEGEKKKADRMGQI